MTEAEERYVAEIVELLPRWVGSAHEPVWAVALSYSTQSPELFSLIVESEARRDARVSRQTRTWWGQRPTDAYPTLTRARDSEVPTSDEIEDELLLLSADLDVDDEPGNAPLLAEACRRLNAAPERFAVPRTGDFIVFCCTQDGDDLERDVLACVPPERAELFRVRGWL